MNTDDILALQERATFGDLWFKANSFTCHQLASIDLNFVDPEAPKIPPMPVAILTNGSVVMLSAVSLDMFVVFYPCTTELGKHSLN